MTDWLSKIEDAERKYQRVLGTLGRGEPPETQKEHMARVLRELGEYINWLNRYVEEETTYSLSDDAKELLK